MLKHPEGRMFLLILKISAVTGRANVVNQYSQ